MKQNYEHIRKIKEIIIIMKKKTIKSPKKSRENVIWKYPQSLKSEEKIPMTIWKRIYG